VEEILFFGKSKGAKKGQTDFDGSPLLCPVQAIFGKNKC
jgi:hypothetical protein